MPAASSWRSGRRQRSPAQLRPAGSTRRDRGCAGRPRTSGMSPCAFWVTWRPRARRPLRDGPGPGGARRAAPMRGRAAGPRALGPGVWVLPVAGLGAAGCPRSGRATADIGPAAAAPPYRGHLTLARARRPAAAAGLRGPDSPLESERVADQWWVARYHPGAQPPRARRSPLPGRRPVAAGRAAQPEARRAGGVGPAAGAPRVVGPARAADRWRAVALRACPAPFSVTTSAASKTPTC